MKKLIYLSAVLLVTGSCKKNTETIYAIDPTRKFTVLIENVSDSATLEPGAFPDQTAPLSHGVWAVFTEGALFNINQAADEGTSRIAEDAISTVKTNDLNNSSWVSSAQELRVAK